MLSGTNAADGTPEEVGSTGGGSSASTAATGTGCGAASAAGFTPADLAGTMSGLVGLRGTPASTVAGSLEPASSASSLLAWAIVGRSAGSGRSSCMSSAVSAPACFGGCTIPSATRRNSASWFCRSGNGGPPSTAS